jgi:hypothetical protein
VRLSSRASTTRDNLAAQQGRPTLSDYVLENGVVYTLPSRTRLELSLDNRNELHLDDLESHAVDTGATSYRVGARYRLDRHMARAAYELRSGLDRGGGRNRETATHVASTQLQSRLIGDMFSTATLQLSRSLEGPDGTLLGDELLSGLDLSTSLFKYLGASSSYTLQERTGSNDSRTHSAVLTFRTQSVANLSAEAGLQLKRTLPKVGQAIGDSVLSGRASYQFGSKAHVTADYQRRLVGLKTVGPVILDTRGAFKPSKEWELGGGYRIDQYQDPNSSVSSYTGRIGYVEATVNF